MCGVFLDATFHGGSNDTIGGRGRLQRPEISPSYPLELSPFLGSSPPATKLLPVSLSPVINCSPASTTPAITANPWQRLFTGVNDTGNKFFAGVVDTAEQFITGVVDTGDKQYFANISVNFWKIQNGSNGILGGLGDTDSWKKPEVENLVSDSLSVPVPSNAYRYPWRHWRFASLSTGFWVN